MVPKRSKAFIEKQGEAGYIHRCRHNFRALDSRFRQGKATKEFGNNFLDILRINIRVVRQIVGWMRENIAFAIVRTKGIPNELGYRFQNAVRYHKVDKRGRSDAVSLGSKMLRLTPTMP